MQIVPLGNRVLVQPVKLNPKTPGGIELPDTAQGKPRHGKILAVGPGTLRADGSRQPVGVKKDQRVMYQQYAGMSAGDPTKCYTSSDDPLIMDESDLLAVIED